MRSVNGGGNNLLCSYHFGSCALIVTVYLCFNKASSLSLSGKNRVFNWALNAAEDCVARAVTTAAPIVNRLDRPIAYVDQTLVKGIEQLETKAPIIKDTPQEIYTQAKNKVIDVVQPHLERVVKFKAAGQQKASSLKDLAWQKANEVLATQYGSLAVNGVDTTTALAERLLEYYFPKCDTDVEEDNGKHIHIYRYSCYICIYFLDRIASQLSLTLCLSNMPGNLNLRLPFCLSGFARDNKSAINKYTI